MVIRRTLPGSSAAPESDELESVTELLETRAGLEAQVVELLETVAALANAGRSLTTDAEWQETVKKAWADIRERARKGREPAEGPR